MHDAQWLVVKVEVRDFSSLNPTTFSTSTLSHSSTTIHSRDGIDLLQNQHQETSYEEEDEDVDDDDDDDFIMS